MKIVLAHNFYGSAAPSGENSVYLAELALLRSRGHTVVEFTRHSDSLRKPGAWGAVSGAARGAASTPWNVFSTRALRELLAEEKPDVLHVHNTFPLLSPGIFHVVREQRTATVLTLHNYRLFCAAGIPMRSGVPCTDCLRSRNSFPAVRNACYRSSRTATIPVAAGIELHRRAQTWRKKVDAFIALTEFQRAMLADAGLPAEKMHVKPHFYADPPEPVPWRERDPKVVFVGRLSSEKGVHVLIAAWKRMGAAAPRLDIIGEGPQADDLRRSVGATNLEDRIAFRGRLTSDQVQHEVARSRLLILPSLSYEGFPMSFLEAMALSTPVIMSRLGSMAELITGGVEGALFDPGDSRGLADLVRGLWRAPGRLEQMGSNARSRFDSCYTATTNHDQLLRIYEVAVQRRLARLP